MNISKLLNQSGLSDGETSVFLACKDRFLRASEIEKIVKLKRTNIYAILKSLMEKGLITEIPSQGVKIFKSVSMPRVLDFIEGEKLKLEGEKEKLSMASDLIRKNLSIKNSPNVEIIEGIDEFKNFYKSVYDKFGTIEIKKITKLIRYDSTGDLIEYINSKAESAHKKLGKKCVTQKTIVPDTQDMRRIFEFQKEKHPDYLNYMNFCMVDFSNLSIESEILILPDSVSVISVTEKETWVTRFYDESVTRTFEALFLSLWSVGTKIKKQNE